MSNPFSEFTKMYSFSYRTGDEIASFIQANSITVEFKSGGDATMNIRIHKKMQSSIQEMLNICDRLEQLPKQSMIDHDIKVYEKQISTALCNSITDIAEEEITVFKGKQLKKSDLATHIMQNVYDPLLQVSKQIFSQTSERNPKPKL